MRQHEKQGYRGWRYGTTKITEAEAIGKTGIQRGQPGDHRGGREEEEREREKERRSKPIKS